MTQTLNLKLVNYSIFKALNSQYINFIYYLCNRFENNQADMAQLVEQRIRNAWVTSSSLVIGSKS